MDKEGTLDGVYAFVTAVDELDNIHQTIARMTGDKKTLVIHPKVRMKVEDVTIQWFPNEQKAREGFLQYLGLYNDYYDDSPD